MYSQFMQKRWHQPQFLKLAPANVSHEISHFISRVSFVDESAVTFWGKVDRESTTPRFEFIYFHSELTGPLLAIVDATLELAQTANLERIQNLGLREIENYFRDENHQHSMPQAGALFFPFFERMRVELLHLLQLRSPEFDEKQYAALVIPQYADLSLVEKIRSLQEFIQNTINPLLKRDAGICELVYLDHQSVVLRFDGTCHSCVHSQGSTLEFIENCLRKVTAKKDLAVFAEKVLAET